jgi:hypothetical protein
MGFPAARPGLSYGPTQSPTVRFWQPADLVYLRRRIPTTNLDAVRKEGRLGGVEVQAYLLP